MTRSRKGQEENSREGKRSIDPYKYIYIPFI